jgi:hypothetical protein
MSCIEKVVQTMMLLLLVRLWLLVLILLAMMLTHQHHCLICFGVCLVYFGHSF